jgi:hypothetical protein
MPLAKDQQCDEPVESDAVGWTLARPAESEHRLQPITNDDISNNRGMSILGVNSKGILFQKGLF